MDHSTRTVDRDVPAVAARGVIAAGLLPALLFPALLTWLYFVALAAQPAGIQQTVYVGGKSLQFAFPLLWVLATERRRLLWRRPGRAGLPAALLFGLTVFAATLLAYHWWLRPTGYLAAAGEAIGRKVRNFGVHGPLGFFALGAFYSVGHSFLEEYYWRWFVFGQLRRLMALWPAVLISSVAFMAHHVLVLGAYFGWFSWPTVLFSLAVAVGGAFWAWLYQRSGSLYGPWLSHLLVDAAIFTVGFDLARISPP